MQLLCLQYSLFYNFALSSDKTKNPLTAHEQEDFLYRTRRMICGALFLRLNGDKLFFLLWLHLLFKLCLAAHPQQAYGGRYPAQYNKNCTVQKKSFR